MVPRVAIHFTAGVDGPDACKLNCELCCEYKVTVAGEMERETPFDCVLPKPVSGKELDDVGRERGCGHSLVGRVVTVTEAE